MKKTIKYGLNLLPALVILCMAGCYSDKSTLPKDRLDDIVIDTTGIPSAMYINYRQEFSVSPTVTRNGNVTDDLEYVWDINVVAGSNPLNREVVGREMTFKGSLPNLIASNPYILKLTVTDPKTGVIYICAWNIYVTSEFRDGIVVSDTRDGSTSDLSLIMNDKITTNWSGEEAISRNILDRVNGAGFGGLMQSVYYFPVYYGRLNALWVIDQNGQPTLFNCEDYSVYSDMSKELFIYATADLKAYGFSKANQALMLNTSEGIYKYNYLGGIPQFGPQHVSTTTSVANNNIFADDHRSNNNPPALVWYDKEKGKFYWFYSDMIASLNVVAFADDDDSGSLPFNAGRYAGKTAIAGGNSFDANTLSMLMKDDLTGNYEICTFSKYVNASGDDPEIMPRAKTLITIPSSANALFDEAIGFVFSRQSPLLYLITPGGIYAVTTGTDPANIVATAKFTPPSGESITIAKLFEQGRYLYEPGDYDPGNSRYPALDMNLKSLIVATSSGSNSGKVYLLPIENLSTGDLDLNEAMEWDGFGKILDVSVQGY